LKSLPLLRRDRLLRTTDPPRVDHGFARQFMIGAPFIENLCRGTGGGKKADIQGVDQGEGLDAREKSVWPWRAGPPEGGAGGNRGGAKVQRHYCSYPEIAHAGVPIRHFAACWQTDIESVIAQTS
jgi:hypothetical protein